MDRMVIDSSFNEKVINVNKDSYLLINSDVQSNNFEINIMDCKVKIIDISKIKNKVFNVSNSDVEIIEIASEVDSKVLALHNIKSNLEYNVIDLIDTNICYKITEETIEKEGKTNINIASISYKNVTKDYIVNTSNLGGYSVNEVNCFGIVKDKSLLNYDITSFIKQGAKKSVVRQNSNILLMDEESFGKNNPILLIEENDVKASHGSSIGKIDDDTMFYLCSRGLTKNEATNLICLGKVEYLINKIDDKDIKESLVNKFRERMI